MNATDKILLLCRNLESIWREHHCDISRGSVWVQNAGSREGACDQQDVTCSRVVSIPPTAELWCCSSPLHQG